MVTKDSKERSKGMTKKQEPFREKLSSPLGIAVLTQAFGPAEFVLPQGQTWIQ
eukprot:SAG31_NODE_465_length_15313_cov_10.762390_5_plen_53_part_00